MSLRKCFGCSILTAALCSGVFAQSVYTFTEDFEDAGWFDGTTWTKEGAPHPEIQVVQFTDGDARLNNATNGSKSGGLFTSISQFGRYTGGDHGEVYLDFHMAVRPGTYTFEVALDQLVYWKEWLTANPGQLWGCGLNFHIGDAATLEYTSQLPHQAPLGPWIAPSFDGYLNFAYAMLDIVWQGSPTNINGQWVHRDYQQAVDGTGTFTTTGHAIFRVVMRNKWNISDHMAFAVDNLRIDLRSTDNCRFPIVFDLDDDGDVDMTDFAGFQRCIAAEAGLAAEPDCLCFDVDGDGAIDQLELAAFMNCASGADVPADAACNE